MACVDRWNQEYRVHEWSGVASGKSWPHDLWQVCGRCGQKRRNSEIPQAQRRQFRAQRAGKAE